MKKAAFVTINNFSDIPVCRFIIELFTSKFNVSIAECNIKGSYDFSRFGKVTYLAFFKDRLSFLHQPAIKKASKYFHLYYHVLYLLYVRRVNVLYTPDLQVLSAVFFYKKIFNLKTKIIYHQFELLDPAIIKGNNLRFWNKMIKHINEISLCIFPEINRLEFFCSTTGFDNTKCMVFANSCREETEHTIRPGILKDIPADDLIIAHIGNVGTNHYLNEFLKFVDCLDQSRSVHILMIGRFSPDVLKVVESVKNSNFYVVGEIPHYELSRYYSFIDIGFILYKGLDLNLEYCAPNKLYEYWSHGIYVIAHPLNGLKSIFTDDNMGKLLNLENASEIEDVVQKFSLIKGRDTRQKIKSGFNHKYSIDGSLNLLNKRLDEFA